MSTGRPAVRARRGGVGQDDGPGPTGGPTHPRRLGPARAHPGRDLHPEGVARAPPAPRPARGARAACRPGPSTPWPSPSCAATGRTGTMRPPVVIDDPAPPGARRRSAPRRSSRAGARRSAVVGELHWAQVSMLRPEDYAAAARAAGATPPSLSHEDVGRGLRRLRRREATTQRARPRRPRRRAARRFSKRTSRGRAAQRWRIRHVFVDEFQDVNPAQWRLLKAWLGDGVDLFVVGDPRQAIYGWNGADPTLLDRLPELLPGTTVLRLDDNHRSTPQVVEAARAVLGADPGQASRPDGPSPVVDGFDDDDARGRGGDTVAAACASTGTALVPSGRAGPHQRPLDPIARALERAGIPHRVGGGAKEAADARRALAELRRAPKTRHLRSALAELVMTRQARQQGEAPASEYGATPASEGGPSPGPGPARRRTRPRIPRRHRGRIPRLGGRRRGRRHGARRAPTVSSCPPSTAPRDWNGRRWPSSGSRTAWCPSPTPTTPPAVAEERRLLYVALTRAEDELWCSWARTRRVGERTWRCDPSPLLAAVEEASRDRVSGPRRPPALGADRVAPDDAARADRPRQLTGHDSVSMSTRTGAWSEGSLPLRALRSTRA